MCTNPLLRIKEIGSDKAQVVAFNYIEQFRMKKFQVFQQIPCGQCIECRLENARQWAFRCVKEAEQYSSNVMLTLTYDNENLPKKINEITGEVTNTLKKEDITLFLKRLRKHYGNNIRFYMCGEYGSDKSYTDYKGNERTGTKRPHYHIIVFNLNVPDAKFFKYSITEWSKEKNALYKSSTMDKIWGKGTVILNEVNYETCNYVARYVLKKQKGPKSKEYYEEQGIIPEYTNMSRKPGIGQAYFEKHKETFTEDAKIWARTKKGLEEFKPGRYYDKLLEKDNPEALKEIKKKRNEKSKMILEQILGVTDLGIVEYTENQDRKVEKQIKINRA